MSKHTNPEDSYKENLDSHKPSGIVLNYQFPDTLQQVADNVKATGNAWCNDDIYQHAVSRKGDIGFYTVPKYAKIDDYVFIMSAKSASVRIRRIAKELQNAYAGQPETRQEYSSLVSAMETAKVLQKRHGGKVFAVGRIVSAPHQLEKTGMEHWRSNIYARIADVRILNVPIDVLAMDPFVRINRFGAATALTNDALAVLLSEAGY